MVIVIIAFAAMLVGIVYRVKSKLLIPIKALDKEYINRHT